MSRAHIKNQVLFTKGTSEYSYISFSNLSVREECTVDLISGKMSFFRNVKVTVMLI